MQSYLGLYHHGGFFPGSESAPWLSIKIVLRVTTIVCEKRVAMMRDFGLRQYNAVKLDLGVLVLKPHNAAKLDLGVLVLLGVIL
jgi:hypothetical protein